LPYLLDAAYLLVLLAALPWLVWQSFRTGKYREGYAEKFLGLVPRRASAKKCLWFHAVSVGEVNLIAPLVQLIERERPDWQCVVSTTTRTGMALARKKYAGLSIFYCPLDFSWAVRAGMKRMRPDVLILVELELWPNLIAAARASGARVAVINGRLSEKSHRGYRRIRPLVARLLRNLDLIAVQDETYAARFRDLGALPSTVQVTGSMKFDGAQTDRNNPATKRLAALAGFTSEDVVFLAGSTQEGEEQVALNVYRRLWKDWPQLRLVIVPRHPERFDCVARLLDADSVPWQRRSTLDSGGNVLHARILLVDAVGELGAWWGTATIAFVGGSLGNRGGQNMIEPAAYGAAVSFGPNTRNFRDIVSSLLARQAAQVVENEEALHDFVLWCLKNPGEAALQGDRARKLVFEQIGATAKTFELQQALVASTRVSRVGQASDSERRPARSADQASDGGPAQRPAARRPSLVPPYKPTA
jgi:3-deoxy-D-manno-octulosonic-acid transferase